MFQSDHKPSTTRSFFWLLVLPIAFSVLAFFLTLPLRWKDQAVLGCLLIASAMVTNRFLSTRVATLFLSLSACFCTARYAYYRYSETIWNFRTSWSQIQSRRCGFCRAASAIGGNIFVRHSVSRLYPDKPASEAASQSHCRRFVDLADRGCLHPDVQRATGRCHSHGAGGAYDGLPERQIPGLSFSMTAGDLRSPSSLPNAAQPM